MSDQTDPFANSEGRPSVSFKNAPMGTEYVFEVIELPKMVQSIDFDTRKPKFWDEEKTQPCMSVVVGVRDSEGEKSLWAPKPGSMFSAIASAQIRSGQRIALGSQLRVKLVAEKPVDGKPHLNPQKIYEAAHSTADPLAAAPAPQAQGVAPPPPPIAAAVPAPPAAGPTYDQLIAAGWTADQIVGAYPHLAPAPPAVPAPPVAKGAAINGAAGGVSDAQAAALAQLTDAQRVALGLA